MVLPVKESENVSNLYGTYVGKTGRRGGAHGMYWEEEANARGCPGSYIQVYVGKRDDAGARAGCIGEEDKRARLPE